MCTCLLDYLSTYLCGKVLFLNGCIDQVTPLGPRTIIVLDAWITEQVLQYKPGQGRALTDAAVGDDFLIRLNPFSFVERTQFLGGLERAVCFIDRLRPRNAHRAGDMTATRCSLLRVVRHG